MRRRDIEEIEGEPLSFRVPSDTLGAPPYLVHLDALNGNGECRCNDFTARKVVELRAGVLPNDLTTRCKHIRRARAYFLDKIIKQYNANLKTAGLRTHHCST